MYKMWTFSRNFCARAVPNFH